MAKFINKIQKPFAQDGDRSATPETDTRLVNQTTGFTGFYSKPPTEDGEFITRQSMNGILYETQIALQETQDKVITSISSQTPDVDGNVPAVLTVNSNMPDSSGNVVVQGGNHGDSSESLTSADGNAYVLTTLADGVLKLTLFGYFNSTIGQQYLFTLPMPLDPLKYSVTFGSTTPNYIIGYDVVLDASGNISAITFSTTPGTGSFGTIHIEGIINLAEAILAPKILQCEVKYDIAAVVFDVVDTTHAQRTQFLVKSEFATNWSVWKADVSSPYDASLPAFPTWELVKLAAQNIGATGQSVLSNICDFVILDNNMQNIVFVNGIGKVTFEFLLKQTGLTTAIYNNMVIKIWASETGSNYLLVDTLTTANFEKLPDGDKYRATVTNPNVFGASGKPFIRLRLEYKTTNPIVTCGPNPSDYEYTKPVVTTPVLSYVASTKTLNWTNPSTSSIGFKLFKNGELFQDNLTGLTYTDSTMANNDKYYVVGYNGLINAKSNEITAVIFFTVLASSFDAGIKLSTDGGDAWGNTSVTTGGYYSLAYLGNNRVLAGSNIGIKLSIDGGSTWSDTSVTTGGYSSLAYLGNNRVLAGSGNIGIRLSTDGGSTWVTTTITTGGYSSLAYLGNNRVLAGGIDVGIKLSTDGGSTWSDTSMISSSYYSLAYLGNNRVLAGSNIGIRLSTDGGSTWVTTPVTASAYFSLTYLGNNRVLAGGVNVGIKLSTDGGSTWVNTSVTTGTYRSLVYLGNNRVLACNDNNGIKLSIDGGSTWVNTSITTGTYYALAYLDGSLVPA